MKLMAHLLLAMALWAVIPFHLGAQSVPAGETPFAAPETSAGCDTFVPVPDDSASHGFNLANLDRSVQPCDDFFHFADGGWIKSNPIPPQYPSWGVASKLAEDNREKLHQILETAAKNTNTPAGSVDQKIGDFYSSCMNEAQIEKAGVQPLQDEFNRIEKISGVAELQSEIARMQGIGVNALFGFGAQVDAKNSTQMIAGAYQGGLGLPDRDYYLKTDPKSQQTRDAYVQHVQKMFELLGDDAAKAAAETKTVMDIETRLANASMTRVEQRDPDKTYHKMNLSELAALTPNFSWTSYFREVGFPAIDTVDVGQPDFFKEVNSDLTGTPMADWKVYLRWNLINASAESLSAQFVEEDFNFYEKTLTGSKEILPRWQRCVRSTDHYLGEALGQIYVKDYFPPEAKAHALEMVHNLMAALRADIATLDWMSEETRKQAIVKLDAYQLKIGYPDVWRDYSAYKVDRGIYIEVVQRGEIFARNYRLSKIGKPVDRKLWGMTPPTVNAYYSPTMNEIVFPAGILQPPFYDPNRDDALNYGGVGSVIGHEMTHGFDDQGSKFDAQGNLHNWWTPQDLKNFQERGDCVAKQFDSFVVEEGLHENGKLVEGESIADLGGLVISYAAFEKSLETHGRPGPIDGFTPEQRFFLGFAQLWAGSIRPEYARLIVNTNPHPLPQFRAIAPLVNMPEFAKAFHCPEKSAMVRPESERCRIW
jgi:putative endopeptidase